MISITKTSDHYDKKYIKVNFNSDDDLPLNSTIEIHNVTIVVRESFLRWMLLWIINDMKMLYYDRIEVSEGINVNKTSESKEYDICHYWYFLNKGFKFQSNVCNRCYDILIVSVNFDWKKWNIVKQKKL